MKHIVIVNHNAGSPYHGPNFRSYYSAIGWVKSGYKVTIVCSSFSHKLNRKPKVSKSFKKEIIDGVNFLWLKTIPYKSNVSRLFNYLHFYFKLNNLSKYIVEDVDYVICSSPPPLWIWSCLSFARNKDSVLFFEARDLWPDVVIETTRFWFFNPVVWIMKLAEKISYLKSDHVIGVNASAIKIMSKRGLRFNKFTAIPNGFHRTNDQSKNQNLEVFKDILKLKEDGWFMIGYSGALSPVYSLDYFLDAAKALKSEKIAFILAGKGKYEQKIKKASKALRNVLLAGWVDKNDLQTFLSLMDVCFAGLLDFPSFTFGSDSTKLYEYMNASKPILHSINDDNSVVVRSNGGVRVNAESSEEIINGIKYLQSKDTNELEELGKNGKKYLELNNSSNVLSTRWNNLFEMYSKSINDKSTK